jgi:phage terminase small subunit
MTFSKRQKDEKDNNTMNRFNPRETKFIDQMVQFCGKKTATQCAIDSGYNSAGARTRASELMARADIRDEIDLRLEEVRKKWLITKDLHYQELGELRDMAKETKNVNAAVRAEELRGKVAGLYIDRSILASTKMVRLPDGTMKLEQDLTESDVESQMKAILLKHKVITAHDGKRKK